MPECRCGAHVSPDYARVFGAGGEVRHCPRCVSLFNRERREVRRR